MNEITSNVMMDKLISDIESIVSAAKEKIAGSVNSVMTEAYWTIGKYIVEFEQEGQARDLLL